MGFDSSYPSAHSSHSYASSHTLQPGTIDEQSSQPSPMLNKTGFSQADGSQYCYVEFEVIDQNWLHSLHSRVILSQD